LARAIESVLRQVHQSWELLVVDDGSVDDTGAVLEAVDDPRVRVFASGGEGDVIARNVALERATGEVIAYLDDDNIMLPLWLKAVAWAFERHPDDHFLYGARIFETWADNLPELQFEGFDRQLLGRTNYIDTSVIAHRRGSGELRWDNDIAFAADWELASRLAADRPPVLLPVRAVLYGTSATGRRSISAEAHAHYDEMRRRLAGP
jgi:glycosyltransferase involved in cell wall biosynthesis